VGRLIRLDRTGHTTLAEWDTTDEAARAQASRAFEVERDRGMIASVSRGGTAEVVRELPADAELVIMRRPIAGG
jgi:hypothetical protein